MTSRPNLVLAIVVALIAAIAVLAGVASATRDVREYDPGTPEGVVQDFVTSLIEQDDETALELLAEDTRCSVSDFDNAGTAPSIRVILRDATVDGDSARVRVAVGGYYSDPFPGAEQLEEHTYRLIRTSGDWRIDGTPWPLYDCGREF